MLNRMSLKELREADVEEIKKQIEIRNPWTAVHIRSKYNKSIEQWLRERYNEELLLEEVWGGEV